MIIRITQGVCRMPQCRLAKPVDFELLDGEHLAIVGANASGKTMLVDMLVGRYPLIGNGAEYDFTPSTKSLVSDNIKYITFCDSYGGDNDRTYFLQQRWNQMEIDESTPTVGELLEEAYQQSGEDTTERRALLKHLYELFHLSSAIDLT